MPLGFVWVCCLFLWRSGLWTSETEPSANVIQTFFFFEEGFVFHLKCLMKIPIWLCFLCCGCIYSPQQWPSAISAPLWFSRGLSSGVCCWSSFSSALLPHPKLTKPYCALSYRTVGKRWAGYLGQMLTRSSFTACVCVRETRKHWQRFSKARWSVRREGAKIMDSEDRWIWAWVSVQQSNKPSEPRNISQPLEPYSQHFHLKRILRFPLWDCLGRCNKILSQL